MPDDVTRPIAELLPTPGARGPLRVVQTPRDQALRVARELECCNAILVPKQPAHIRHLSVRDINELRSGSQLNDADRAQLRDWNEWAVARSSAIAENVNRLRGLLWCYRVLVRASQDNESDRDAAGFYELVRDFLAEVWRIPNPPLDRVACALLAETVVRGLCA